MSLSLKAELETWAAALKAYDEQDFDMALDLFSRIADSSKILTNMGLIYATIGEHETAIEHFVAATNLDAYLAIAYFQCGVSNFLLGRYDLALLNFEDAYLYLRGNEAINYEQIGLKFKLFSAEVMFNKGLTEIYLGYLEGGMADMQEASRQQVTEEHGVIDEAVRDRGEGYTVFSIPVGVLYRPSEHKLKNSKSRDYLGKARATPTTPSPEFTGVKKLQQASGEDLENKEDKDKPDAGSFALSRSATAPAPRPNPVPARPPLERSRTAIQPGVGARPNAAIILASRRTNSDSNPPNVPLPPLPSDLSRSNTALLQGQHGSVGVGAGSLMAGAESGAAAGGAQTLPKHRPSTRRPQGQGAPQVAQQSAPLPPLPHLLSGQYVNAPQGATPLVLPATLAPAQGEGQLTQFYDAYMDVYVDDATSRSAIPHPPTAQARSSGSSSRRQSPAPLSFYQQPQPEQLEQQRLPAWMQSAPSSVRTSNYTSSSSGISRAPSRAANAGMMNANSNTGMGMNMEHNVGMGMVGANMGGISNAGGGTVRRKPTRRGTTRRVKKVYDDDEGDDGFVTGENDEEMANIRVKLHYQGDVRGMAIPPTVSFNEFVERVTAKFGTSLMGLGMKFTDEDGTKITLRDESDFELAIETARESAKGRSEGKIEIWCVDVV
ncbi:NADPH oxidase regulator NoxR [Butyriboletus roseoflavus]|nr:NADPH oxidase regulator NoxR [Butyriboletus roseoflavus]